MLSFVRSRPQGIWSRVELNIQIRENFAKTKSSKRWMQEHVSDVYVKEAIKNGFRSRASFKLIEMQKKYKFLKPNQKVLDLGCAPGGWTQVAVQYTKGKTQDNKSQSESKLNVLGIDRDIMNPVEGAYFYKGDLLDEKTRLYIPEYFNMQPIDVCMSDMAPNFCGDLDIDHHNINQLNNICLDISISNLRPGGTLLMKTLQGKHENMFFKQYAKYFKQFQRVKPGASRSRSSEIYYLGRGFKMSKQYFVNQKFQKKIEEGSQDIVTEQEMSLEEQAQFKQVTIAFLKKQIRLGNYLDPQTIKDLQAMPFLSDFDQWEALSKGKITKTQDPLTDTEKFEQIHQDSIEVFGENSLSFNTKQPDFFSELDSFQQSIQKAEQAHELSKDGPQEEGLLDSDDELHPEDSKQLETDLYERYQKFFTNTKPNHEYMQQSSEEKQIDLSIQNNGQEQNIDTLMNSGTLKALKEKALNIESLRELEKIKHDEETGDKTAQVNLESFMQAGEDQSFTKEQLSAIWQELEECKEDQERYKTQSAEEFIQLRSKKSSYRSNQSKIDQFEKLFDPENNHH